MDDSLEKECDGSGRQELRRTVIHRLIGWNDRREPLVCDIAERLASEIIFGDLEPGTSLNTVDLAQRFGVSRTPVREALMLLEQEGLVEIRARRRARVASPTRAEIREMYGLRANLLALMVRELVNKVSNEQLGQLAKCVDALLGAVATGEVEGYFFRHVEFQDLMTEFTGNKTLKRVLDSLALRTLVLRHASASTPGRMEVGAAEQQQLLQAISSRDGELAAAIVSHSTHQALHTLEHVWRS